MSGKEIIIEDDFDVTVALKSKEHPNSLYNLLPAILRPCVDAIPREYFTLSPDELETSAKDELKRNMSRYLTLKKLRVAFWQEHAMMIKHARSFDLNLVVKNVCSMGFFMKLANSPLLLYYILQPPEDYKVQMEEALLFGLDQLREILAMELDEFEKKDQAKMADVQRRIVVDFMNYSRGMPVHRTVNVNLDEDASQPQRGVEQLEEIDDKLKRLEERLKSQ